MKEIFLTGGKVALVDDIDYAHLMSISRKWYVHSGGYPVNKNKTAIYIHREVAKRMGLDISKHIDHIDKNKFNNQRNNLRSATSSQNLMNRGATIKSKSGIKCIHFDEERNKWFVQVRANNRYVLKKRFDSLDEAIEARNKAIRDNHGEFGDTDC